MTTAELNIVEFDPRADFDLKAGVIKKISPPSTVDYIKFFKNLASGLGSGKQRSWHLRDANQNNDRMVMIVRADKFLNFLKTVYISTDDFSFR